MSDAKVAITIFAKHINQLIRFTYGNFIIGPTLAINYRLWVTAAYNKLAIFIKLQPTLVIPGESKMKPPSWDMVEQNCPFVIYRGEFKLKPS